MTCPRKSFRSLRYLLLPVCICLLLACPVPAAQVPDLKAGEAAFARGDFKSAFTIFQQLVRENPGDPELDFLFGRSAYETGDYEAAIFAFERVLIVDPDADRVRLELGRSYFELGEYQSARTSFQEVLAHEPPAKVQANIRHYLELIDRASSEHQFSGLLSVGLSYDDNVYAAPVEDVIRTTRFDFILDDKAAKAQEDFISQNTFALSHLYRQHPRRPGWLTGLVLYDASYFDKQDLNLNLLGVTSGPVWQQGQWQGRLQGGFNYLTLGHDRYLTTLGLETEQTWRPDAVNSLALAGALNKYDYAFDNRDSTSLRLLARPARSFGDIRISADLGGEWNEAKDDQYSYFRYLARLGCESRLPGQLTLNLGLRLQDTIYSGVVRLFGKKRQDILREASLGLSRVLWKKPEGGELRALVNYVYTFTTSNIALYKYDKQVLSLALNYLF